MLIDIRSQGNGGLTRSIGDMVGQEKDSERAERNGRSSLSIVRWIALLLVDET